MSTVKIGDYVLATKYIDGDPCDQWCIGFVSEHWPSKKRWLVRDSEGEQLPAQWIPPCRNDHSRSGRRDLATNAGWRQA